MIAVIGCGNPNRSDDGVGLEVIRILRQRADIHARADVKLLDAGTDGMAVMFAARGCTTLLIIDSCKSQSAPGAIFEVPGSEAQSQHEASLNLHGFRWDHALYAGRKIYREAFPADVTAFLIEAKNLELGCELSNEVRTAAIVVADKIAARISETPVQFESAGAVP